MAYVLTSLGKQIAILPSELVTKAQAQAVIDSLVKAFPGVAFSQNEWQEPDSKATVVYPEDTTTNASGPRIRQIMPGFQDAAQLFNAMNAVSGSWTGTPDAATWKWDGKAKPADNSGGAPNAAIMPGPSPFYQQVLDDLAAIKAKLGA